MKKPTQRFRDLSRRLENGLTLSVARSRTAIVVVIERTIAWLVRKAAVRPTPARVVPFPYLRPAP